MADYDPMNPVHFGPKSPKIKDTIRGGGSTLPYPKTPRAPFKSPFDENPGYYELKKDPGYYEQQPMGSPDKPKNNKKPVKKEPVMKTAPMKKAPVKKAPVKKDVVTVKKPRPKSD